jgi:rhodanese-related sulfurtransferase
MEDVNNKNMKNKLSDWITLGGLVVLLLLVIFQRVTHNHFRNDAAKWALPSIENKNIINASGMASMPGNTLIVDLSGRSQLINAKHLPADEILEKQNFKILHGHKGNIVLLSDDPSQSARIWMLLSQMGIKDLYILEEH